MRRDGNARSCQPSPCRCAANLIHRALAASEIQHAPVVGFDSGVTGLRRRASLGGKVRELEFIPLAFVLETDSLCLDDPRSLPRASKAISLPPANGPGSEPTTPWNYLSTKPASHENNAGAPCAATEGVETESECDNGNPKTIASRVVSAISIARNLVLSWTRQDVAISPDVPTARQSSPKWRLVSPVPWRRYLT